MQKEKQNTNKKGNDKSNNRISDELMTTLETVQKGIENLTSMVSNTPNNDNELDNLAIKVEEFVETNAKNFNSIDEWNILFEEYQSLTDEVKTLSEKSKQDQDTLDGCERLLTRISVSYEIHLRIFNIWQIKNFKSLDNKIDRQQVSTFAVFSIFITLLTFILTNVTLSQNFEFKNYLLVNLLLIFIATILFSFLGVFLGVVGKTGSKQMITFKYILLLILPLLALSALIFCLCKFGV